MLRFSELIAAAVAWLKSLLRELMTTVSPVDPLDPVARETKMKRVSSHLSLFHPLSRHSERKTLVLDLDETLVHSSPEWVRA